MRTLQSFLPISLLMVVLAAHAQDTAQPQVPIGMIGRGERHVRVIGTVHDVCVRGNRSVLQIDDQLASLVVFLPAAAEGAPVLPEVELLDAVVEVTGIAASCVSPDPLTDGDRRWASLKLESKNDLRVIRSGRDPFALPIQTLAALGRSLPSPQGERVHMQGTITYASKAGWFYFKDDTGYSRGRRPDLLAFPQSVRREVEADTNLSPGDVIDLIGQLSPNHPGNGMPWLIQCEWRVLRHGPPAEHEPVELSEVLDGGFDGKPITIDGRIQKVSTSKDVNGFINHRLFLNGFSALVQLPFEQPIPHKAGNYVRMKGVASVYRNASGAATQLRVNINDFTDISPIWFAVDRQALFEWSLWIAALVLAAAAWIILLRRQVRSQTAKFAIANAELARFKQLAETSSDCICIATLDGTPIYFNSASAALYGIPPDADWSTIRIEKVTTPESAALILGEGIPHALKHGHWQAEIDMRRLNGEVVAVSFVGVIIRGPNGEPQHLASVARDISARQTLESQLRESNSELQRFKAIADKTSDLVGMCDLQGRTFYLNASGREMLGIGADESLKAIAWADTYPPETLALFESEAVRGAMAAGSWSGEILMRHRSGTDFPVSFVGLVLRASDGEPLHMGCIARDLAARLKLEEQLRASLDYERELNQLKSGFVNTISHEFRTPLSIILFASSMLRRFNERFSADEREAQLNGIDQAVERMNELVEQALSLGRAEVAAPKLTAFDLRKFSSRLIDEVLSATSHRSPISLTCDESLPDAHTDDMMLRTIIANLLSNAVKYSPAGSTIELRAQRLNAHQARFTVRDHGPGLSDEDLPKLFTSFHRGQGTESIPGTGLGLAIVKRCAEALGGTAIARNAFGGGAEFIVELPLFTPCS